MSKWIDRITDHPIHEEIDKFLQTLKQASDVLEENASASEAINRLEHITRTANRAISKADPVLLAPSTLSTINKSIQQSAASVSSFISDKNEQHLNTANDAIDNIMPSINRMLIKPDKEDAESLGKTIKSILDIADDKVQTLALKTKESLNELADMSKKIGNLGAKITEEKSRIDQAITQHQQQFSDAQDSRQKHFDQSMQERLKKIEVVQTTWDSKFSSIEVSQQEKFSELLNSFKTADQKFRDETSEESRNLIIDLNSQCEQAKKIVGIISGTGMAGGYQKDANAEWWSSNAWNAAAVGGFLGLIVFAIKLFDGAASPDFSWPALVARILTIGAFGAFATYAGRMASKHRESERQHRHKQLALESVNSFIEDLEPDTQKKLKHEIAGAFFVRSNSAADKEEAVTSNTIDGLISLLNTTISKFKD